jgi:putative transposase
MPRVARIYTEAGVFHILARGNNKQNIFHGDADFHAYKSILMKYKEEHPHKLYHYCLMTNHIHLILETNNLTGLSRFMKRVNLAYFAHYKRAHGYAGHFWQDRFKSLLISKDEYLLACGLYTERNPVRANIVSLPGSYKHSSYAYYAYGAQDELVDDDPLYEGMGKTSKERQGHYRGLAIDERLHLNKMIFSQLFLGSDDFIRRMEKAFNVKNVRQERGRPKKRK